VRGPSAQTSFELDHVFVCTDVGAPGAAALAGLGLTEGSPNTHPGQGTACRRFFFHNAYIELVWVSDPEEARSQAVAPTRLWERWSGRVRTACPFAVVLRGEAGAPAPFETWKYRAPYLPSDVSIEVAIGTSLSEPELFYISAARRPRQPIDHALPVRELSRVEVQLPGGGPRSEALRSVQAAGLVEVRAGDDFLMELGFDDEAAGRRADLRPELPLALRW
jgi:hypothetical protein